MQASKAMRYLGLCIRAGKLTCGFNALEAEKKDVYLLILCSSASENAKKSALKLKNKFGCELLEYNLAGAILSVSGDDLKIYSGGNG